MSRLYRFLSENALVTLGLVIWGLTLITWVTWRVFGDAPPDIPMGTATAFGAQAARDRLQQGRRTRRRALR